MAALASGCASNQLPDDKYAPFAASAAYSQACVAAGEMAPEVAGLGMAASNKRLRTWDYSRERLSSAIAAHGVPQVSSAVCRQLAQRFYTMAHEEGLLGSSQSDGRSWRDLDPAPANTPKTTWCNKLGQSVVCNTY